MFLTADQILLTGLSIDAKQSIAYRPKQPGKQKFVSIPILTTATMESLSKSLQSSGHS